MNKDDINKIEKIISDREEAHNFLISKRSKVYSAFLELELLKCLIGFHRKHKKYPFCCLLHRK